MPHADPMLAKLAGASIFFNLDFIHGYWQIPARGELARMRVFDTSFCVLHTESSPGWCNELRLQFPIKHGIAVLSPRSAHLAGNMLGYASDAKRLVATLKAVFYICLEKCLRLNPLKCDLAAINAAFCSRIINSKGIKFHPHHYKALTSMEPPTTVGALMELFHGANWMRTAIPSFSELIEPLHNILESQYSVQKDPHKIENSRMPSLGMGGRAQGCIYIPHSGDRSSSLFGDS